MSGLLNTRVQQLHTEKLECDFCGSFKRFVVMSHLHSFQAIFRERGEHIARQETELAIRGDLHSTFYGNVDRNGRQLYG